MSDLTTLLLDDVFATEPTAALDAMVPIGLGRRRLRLRRMTSGAVAVAVIAVGTAFLAPHLRPDDRTAVVDPGPDDLPTVIDDHVRPVLERSVPGIGEGQFGAYSSSGAPLPEDDYEGARFVHMQYGLGGGDLVTVALSEAEYVTANFVPPCAEVGDDRTRSECHVLTQDGPRAYVVDRVLGVEVTAAAFGSSGSGMPRHMLAHQLVVVDGSRTLVVEETVPQSPGSAPEDFIVPSADLLEIAQDPALDIDLPLHEGTAH